jgi:hypothetical protein
MKREVKPIHLPHEIVESDDRTGNVQRRVEDICEVICKVIPLKRMGTARPLFVGHGFLVRLVCLSESVAGLKRV